MNTHYSQNQLLYLMHFACVPQYFRYDTYHHHDHNHPDGDGNNVTSSPAIRRVKDGYPFL